MKPTTFLLALLLMTTSVLAGPVEDVANAEIAFAKAFADRDASKFFSMVAPDANFIGGLRTLRGRDAVVKGWSRLLESPQPPFSWGPERVEVTADGKIGLSTGPIYDPKGFHTGDYSSVWQKQSDGSWKIIFDGPGSAPAEVGKVEEGFVSADDGTKLYYRKFGSGPIAMIVPLDSYLHEHFKQFAGIATVVTYDLRNRGRSERAKDESSWTIQQDAKDLEAVRRELKIDKFIPVGFSYLGIVVAMYAIEHPDRVTRLIQIGPASYRKVGTPLQESNEAMGVPPENEKRMAEARGNPATPGKEQCEATWNVLKYMFVGNPAHAPRFDLGFCALENEWPSNFNNTVMHVMKSMADVAITPEKLQVVKVPVLTIHGDKDRNAPYDGGVDWVKSFPDARLVTVKGAAHASYLDDPVTVFGAIRHFIRGEWPLFSTAAR